MGTLAHAAQAVKGAFSQPLLPSVALLQSLQTGAAWVRWREEDGRSSPYFPLVQGQELLHAKGMKAVEWGAIVPDTAYRWIAVTVPQPMRSPLACHRLLHLAHANCTLFCAPNAQKRTGSQQGKKAIFLDVS